MDTAVISRDTVTVTDSVIETPRLAIPTEVVEQIIDKVAELMDRFYREEIEERIHDLRTCALVARSWVPRSRFHLFCCIVLGSDLRTRRFLNSLMLSPALGQYVEILQIWPCRDDEFSCGWIFKALSALPLPLLPHLRVLAFCELPVLHAIYIPILARFRNVESLWLTVLRKQSLREIIQIISRFPQLRRLYVWGCRWELPGRYYSGKQLNLTTLIANQASLDCDRSFLEWGSASGSTRALTAFRTASDAAGSVMDLILQTCHSTLRELHLDFYRCDVPLLANHPTLQRLALHGSIDDVIPTLARLPVFAPSSLASICVSLWSTLVANHSEAVPENQWKAIDLTLCDSNKFPHLRNVEFNEPPEAEEEPLENPKGFFQRVLPNSYVRGILWYRCGSNGPRTRVAPVGAPQYPKLPLEWDYLPEP